MQLNAPSVGALLETIFKDIGNLFSNPSSENFYAIFADFSLFYIVPFVGGFMRMEMYK